MAIILNSKVCNGSKACALVLLAAGLAFHAVVANAENGGKAGDDKGKSGIMWINHFGMVSGNASELRTTANSTTSGIGSGLTGLVVQPGPQAIPGDKFSDGGNKVLQTALVLPKNTQISRVRVCYENTSSFSYITEVGLIQVEDPPSTGVVKLDDKTNLTSTAPICVNTSAARPAIKSKSGPVLLVIRFNMANPDDKIVIRGLGLIVK